MIINSSVSITRSGNFSRIEFNIDSAYFSILYNIYGKLDVKVIDSMLNIEAELQNTKIYIKCNYDDTGSSIQKSQTDIKYI